MRDLADRPRYGGRPSDVSADFTRGGRDAAGNYAPGAKPNRGEDRDAKISEAPATGCQVSFEVIGHNSIQG